MSTIEIGKKYKIDSQRKGKFIIKVTNISDDFVDGIICGGKATALLSYNERELGENVSLRKQWTAFTEVE